MGIRGVEKCDFGILRFRFRGGGVSLSFSWIFVFFKKHIPPPPMIENAEKILERGREGRKGRGRREWKARTFWGGLSETFVEW